MKSLTRLSRLTRFVAMAVPSTGWKCLNVLAPWFCTLQNKNRITYNCITTAQIRTYSTKFADLKEKVPRPMKQRRKDPIKVAQKVFYDIRKRHQDYFSSRREMEINKSIAYQNSGRIDHQSQSKINVNSIFASLGHDHVSDQREKLSLTDGYGSIAEQNGGRIGNKAQSKINMNTIFASGEHDNISGENEKISLTNGNSYLNEITKISKMNDFKNVTSQELLKTLQQMRLSHADKHEKLRISEIENSLCLTIQSDGLKCLDVADTLFEMHVNHRLYVSKMFDYISKNFDNLEITSIEITRIMFDMFLHGSAPPKMYPKIEEFVSNHMDEFHINDISVVCLGFFRSIRRIESTKLLDKMSEKLLTDIDKVNQFSLVNILKCFRHSGYNNVDFFERLAELIISKKILQNCTNLNILMHVASTYAGLSIFHNNLLDMILKQFVNVVTNIEKSSRSGIRSKDLAKFVWAYGVFVYEPVKYRDSYLKLVSIYTQNVDREDSVYPESLADILQGLMYLQIFPQHLINKMFKIQTATALRDDDVMRKAIQLLMIHNAVKIECPHYTGSTLEQSFVETLAKVDEVKKSLEFELAMRRGLAKVWNSLREMFGEDCVHCHFILPQFRNADIELRFNKERESVKFQPQEFNSSWVEADENHTRIAVEVAGLNQFCLKSSRMKGNYDTKIRQLQLLGYHVILITSHELDDFKKMSHEDRKEYLTQCLSQVWNEQNSNKISE